MNDKQDVFLNGLMVKKPRDNAPDFVKGSISINREALISSLSSRNDEWINLDIKESKKGEYYASINTWKPAGNQPASVYEEKKGDQFDQDIPF